MGKMRISDPGLNLNNSYMFCTRNCFTNKLSIQRTLLYLEKMGIQQKKHEVTQVSKSYYGEYGGN